MRISSARKHIFHNINKKLHTFLNMTTARNFAKNIRWGHTDHKTSTLHGYLKQIRSREAYLLDIFPTVIFMDIEIWLSGL